MAEKKSRMIVDEARRDIATATEQARVMLRKETTELAIALAGLQVRLLIAWFGAAGGVF